MKPYETPWTAGSMTICNKCGKAFGDPEMAEKLKFALKGYLKQTENHKNIRVMVSGCLSVCNKEEQAVVYQPVDGRTEVFTVDQNYDNALKDLKSILENKL